MSKIDELIERLCPDGVEYKKLSCLASYARERELPQVTWNRVRMLVLTSFCKSIVVVVMKFTSRQRKNAFRIGRETCSLAISARI